MITVNDIKIEPTIFPDGCQQVWKLPEHLFTQNEWEVCWNFDSEVELITIMQLMDLVFAAPIYIDVKFTIPYLPYARQDKDISNNLCFGLDTFFKLWGNNIGFDFDLTIFDPHPINLKTGFWRFNKGHRLHVKMPNVDLLAKDYDIVCFPDAGAKARYTTTKPTVYGEKVRDQQTGNITSYNLVGDLDLKDKRVLVVDDICDGGRTFILLGEVLKAFESKPGLYISHGVFSKGQKGVNDLQKFYHTITTTNSLTCNSHTDPQYRYRGVKVVDWKSVV